MQSIAVLNPYGGVYPEENGSNLATLNKILNYVSEGGIWVNVADVPGYYAYNTFVDRIIPIKKQFELVPFMQKLALQIYNIQNDPLNQWNAVFQPHFAIGASRVLEVRRVAVVERNIEPIVRDQVWPKTEEMVSPMFLAAYGDGRCIISLPPLSNDINKQSDFIKERLVKIVLSEIG